MRNSTPAVRHASIAMSSLHLGRQLAALASLADHGLESIVVLMDQPVVPASCDRPWVRVVHVDGRPLPLGEARNAGARAARGETVVFLDVDVIPEAGAVEQLVAEAECTTRGRTMGPR